MDVPGTISGEASGAVAASAHASCARFRGPDPLITGVSRRKLAHDVGHSKGPESEIPLLRWMRAMTFERPVEDPRFASEVVTTAVGALGLDRLISEGAKSFADLIERSRGKRKSRFEAELDSLMRCHLSLSGRRPG